MDRISLLSDSLLHEIFSFLNIKSVIQTCVLSKRWKTLWTQIHTLNFDFDSYPYGEITGPDTNSKYLLIKRFIFRVFAAHRCKSIKKLSLSSSFHINETMLVVELLLCYTRHYEVDELCIDTLKNVYFYWPLDLLKSYSLTVLKMTCGFADLWRDLYSPCLRVLEIEYALDYAPEQFMHRNLEGFLDLESLVLTDCLFETASIEAPKLRNFELLFSYSKLDSFPQLQLLAPELKTVKFRNILPTVKSDSDFSCIQEVNIELDGFDFNGDVSAKQVVIESISKLLQVFHNARSFKLPLKAMEMLLSAPSSLSGCSFHNLRRVKLKTEATNKTTSLHISTLMNSLKCPNLEILDFQIDLNKIDYELRMAMMNIEEKLVQVAARTGFELFKANVELVSLREKLDQIMDSQGGTFT